MLDFICTPDEGAGLIVGVAPLQIQCAPLLPTEGTWDRIVWTFGDGASVEGNAVGHVYPDDGQFTVSVRLEGWEPPAPDSGDTGVVSPSSELVASRFGYVTVCGEPEPEFTYDFHGGLDYALRNRTELDPHCLAELRWDVFEGKKTSGKAWLTSETWEPSFTLPREGTWTVVLTVGGIGGTTSAALEIDAVYALTDDLDLGPQKACDTGGAGVVGVLPLLGLFARRRRR